MTTPRFTAEASFYATSQHYRTACLSSAGRADSVLAQSLLCARAGQTCGGIDRICCPGLRCTAGLGGLGSCVPNFVRCSPCMDGRQFCCPPPGVGLRCFVRSCGPQYG
jgi:hypothetical protein